MASTLYEQQPYLEYIKTIGVSLGHEERMDELREDRRERQTEWNIDLKNQERAGMDENDLIPKLDASNNASYMYLKQQGNTFQYDMNRSMDSKMKKRLYKRFDNMNKNSDTMLYLKDVLYWPERMQNLCKANKEEVEQVRKALKIYFVALGVTNEGIHRANWVEAHRVFEEAEKERERRGEMSLAAMCLSAYLDVVDEDGSNIVSIQEMKRMFNVFRMPEEASYTFMYHVDTKKDGRPRREDVLKMFNRFWTGQHDEELDGLFAYKY